MGQTMRGIGPAIGVGTWSCDLETEKLTWCDGVRAIFGMPPGATPDRATSLQCYESASRHRLDRLRSVAIQTGQPFTLEARLTAASGQLRWMRIVAAVTRDPAARPRLYGIKQDITGERAGLEMARMRPGHDPVTGLPGIAIFEDALLAGSRGAVAGVFIVVALRIDRVVAPSLDMDILALECARRLTKAFPAEGSVARIAPDRFAILLRSRPAHKALHNHLSALAMALRRPISADGGWLRCEVAIGAAIEENRERPDPAGMQARAETALGAALMANDGHARIAGFLPPDRIDDETMI